MNKKLKYVLIFGGTILSAVAIIKIIKASKKGNSETPAGGTTDSEGTYYAPKAKNLDRNKILKAGLNNSDEVKALQRILGVTADGDFGTKETLPALQAQAGVSETTLNKVELQIAALAAKNKTKQIVTAVKSKFPLEKSVVAAVTFRGFANVFRNGEWYSTDSEGNALPSKEFKLNADIGKVKDYKTSDPNIVIIKLSKPIGENGEYSWMGVKKDWIK